MPVSGTKIYLTSGGYDQQWGITTNTVGYTDIRPGYTSYPPKGHPEAYAFNTSQGRILEDYQLIYITRGRGFLYLRDEGRNREIKIKEGDVILLQPMQWHSYFPDKETGWEEYWIGFEGFNMDTRKGSGFFRQDDCVYPIGIEASMTELYNQAILVAEEEKSGCQQMLAGIVNLLLSSVFYIDKNKRNDDSFNEKKLRQAQLFMRKNFMNRITPEDVASDIGMSYSWLRKAFRKYTNISISHYLQSLKINEAKSLLLNSNDRIKDIAYTLDYNNPIYFTTTFRNQTGMTPTEYRKTFKQH